jgi:hypothetical protein
MAQKAKGKRKQPNTVLASSFWNHSDAYDRRRWPVSTDLLGVPEGGSFPLPVAGMAAARARHTGGSATSSGLGGP